ncbi:MAG: hypothetical protein ACRD0P_06930 [Stackebrandtia sp.]
MTWFEWGVERVRLTVTVHLDSVEQVAGQPVSAVISVGLDRGASELLTVARMEAANPHLPDEWRDCAAAMVGARVLGAGLRLGVPAVIASSRLRVEPARVAPVVDR